MKQAVSAKSNAKKIALGVGAALALYLLLLALASLLIVRGTVAEERTSTCVWAFACLAAFAGAKTAAHRSGDPLIPVAGSTIAFWVLIQLLGFLASDTLATARAAWLAIPILVGGAIAYLVRPSGRKGKAGKRTRHSRK